MISFSNDIPIKYMCFKTTTLKTFETPVIVIIEVERSDLL